MARDKNKSRNGPVNIATGNAKVGLQVDGDVVITGGINLGGGSRGDGGKGGINLDALIDAATAAGGTVNVAGDGDTVAFQAGQVHGEDEEQ